MSIFEEPITPPDIIDIADVHVPQDDLTPADDGISVANDAESFADAPGTMHDDLDV